MLIPTKFPLSQDKTIKERFVYKFDKIHYNIKKIVVNQFIYNAKLRNNQRNRVTYI